MILIIYDSVYGNTLKIAEAIGVVAKRTQNAALVVHASHLEATQLKAASVVLIGSPTRAFRPTPQIVQAIRRFRNEWRNKPFAAFDTRMDVGAIDSRLLKTMVRWFGVRRGRHRETIETRSCSRNTKADWILCSNHIRTDCRSRNRPARIDLSTVV
ncbi:MAG: flavodoxin domain-containing protein [Bacillus subtilis]|nr:flavodoxin domain-containing protein [Bacillus subtilis]